MMHEYPTQQPSQEEPPIHRSSYSWKKQLLHICIAIAVLALAYWGISAFFSTEGTDNPGDYDPVTLEPKKPEGLLKRLSHFVFSKDVVLEGEKNDRINILLLGMGGLGHDGPFLTDTIILVSVKPSTNQIAMISIPRDLGVNLPGYGLRKINHANAYGEADKPGWGAATATQVIEDTFDIDIQYYGRIDFKAFEEMIDEVGGVTVDVERSFVDTEYPALNEEYQTVSFTKGVQTMNGKRALTFARSRHGNNGEGSDFARSKRQQKILLALKEKVLSAGTIFNPVRINNIINSLDTHITTNMEFGDMIALLKMAKELDTSNIIRLTIDDSPNGYLQSGATLLPKSGSFDGINYAIEHIFDKETEVTPPNISIVSDTTPEQNLPPTAAINTIVLNGTWKAGLASRVKKILGDKDISVINIGNTEERPINTSGIYVLSDNIPKELTDALHTTLNIPIMTGPVPKHTLTGNTDIVIVLGENFTE